MSHPSAKRKLAVWNRDGWKCAYCGREVLRAGPDQPSGALNTATVDHVLAKAHGGVNAQTNLVTACHGCNQIKGKGHHVGHAAPTLGEIWPDLHPHERALLGGGGQ